MTTMLWKVTGTRHGKFVAAEVEAADHNAAVRKGSHAPHMLVVHSCALVEKSPTYWEGWDAHAAGWPLLAGYSDQYSAGWNARRMRAE